MSVGVPDPACPTCGDRLRVDGERRVCAACGRPFELTVVDAEGGSLYRSAPIVDLAPLRYEVPRSGILVARDDVELDIRVCPGAARWGQWALRGAGLAALLFGLVSSGIAHGPHVFVEMLFVSLFCWFLSARPPMNHDSLTILQSGWGPPILRWIVQRNGRVVRQTAAELGSLIAAHDGGDHVRIELSDGRSWNVGEGLRPSLASRRWLTWRFSKLSALLGDAPVYDGPSSKRILP